MNFFLTLHSLCASEKDINSKRVVIFYKDIQFQQQNTIIFETKIINRISNWLSLSSKFSKHSGFLLSWCATCCQEWTLVRTCSHINGCHKHVWIKDAELNDAVTKNGLLWSITRCCILIFSNVIELQNKKINQPYMESIILWYSVGLVK